MIIEKVVDRFMDENTYIIGDEKTKKCAVIDPGGKLETKTTYTFPW